MFYQIQRRLHLLQRLQQHITHHVQQQLVVVVVVVEDVNKKNE